MAQGWGPGLRSLSPIPQATVIAAQVGTSQSAPVTFRNCQDRGTTSALVWLSWWDKPGWLGDVSQWGSVCPSGGERGLGPHQISLDALLGLATNLLPSFRICFFTTQTRQVGPRAGSESARHSSRWAEAGTGRPVAKAAVTCVVPGSGYTVYQSWSFG